MVAAFCWDTPSATRREVTLMRIALTIDACWPLAFV
jgi:hypothetical protein